LIGYFGDIVFETSDKRILNFADFKRDTENRTAAHEIIGKKPVTEYIGPGLQKVTFTVTLNGNHGVNSRAEMERWLRKVENGEAETLVIGGKPLGTDKWIVRSVSEAWDTIFNGGELFSGKINVTMEEYISRL